MTSEVPSPRQGEANGTYHLKILVPSIAAGAIIGKKGGVIAHLQEETGAKVKMSKSTDFYPGTTERVCLITGTVEAILRLHEFIMLKIMERPDPTAKMAVDFDHKRSVGREKQVKILVPNSTAAMIIGKCGSYIKQIKEESGAYIQISQNDKDRFTLAERCVTVIGEMENNKIACHMILTKIVKDPNSGSCSYISYSNVTGPVPNFDPVGSPFANPDCVPSDALNSSNASYGSSGSLDNSSRAVVNSFHNFQTAATQPGIVPFTGVRMGGSALPLTDIPQAIETVKMMLESNGYSDQASSEITAAMNVLAHYGLLGLDLGILIGAPIVNNLEMPSSVTSCPTSPGDMTNQGVYASASAVPEVETACNTVSGSGSMIDTYSNAFSFGDNFGNEMSASGFRPGFISPDTSFSNDDFVEQTETASFEPFCRTSPTLASPSAAALPINIAPFSLRSSSDPSTLKKYSIPTDEEKYEAKKVDIEIRENVVGAIFGPEGKAIADIARYSGAKIKISKKGEYVPGTRNRIVTISGDSSAIHTAQCLIERQIVQEEAKRAQRSALNFLH